MAEASDTTQLENYLGARIYEPTVRLFHDEFVSYGCVAACSDIYRFVSDAGVVDVIQEVQASQVNREKAIWPIYVARGQVLDINKSVQIGAVVDILWALSVIMDDIVDNDAMRAGEQTIWVKHTKEKAELFARVGLNAVLEYLHFTNGEEASKIAHKYVMNGMRSLELHKGLGLCANPRLILRNYWMRDDFHSALPFHLLYGSNTSDNAKRIIYSMRVFNQAGQLLNDLSDMRLQSDGTYRFSDLSSGRVTFVLRLLYEDASETDKVLIERCFGNGSISPEDSVTLLSMIETPRFILKLSNYVEKLYRKAQNSIGGYFLEEDQQNLNTWIEYKLRKLRK